MSAAPALAFWLGWLTGMAFMVVPVTVLLVALARAQHRADDRRASS